MLNQVDNRFIALNTHQNRHREGICVFAQNGHRNRIRYVVLDSHNALDSLGLARPAPDAVFEKITIMY